MSSGGDQITPQTMEWFMDANINYSYVSLIFISAYL